MILLTVKDLGVTLGASLFSGLSFTLSSGDRLGLVAANGRGKSTLLRSLAAGLDPTSGEIIRARGLKIGHVTQDVPEVLPSLPMRAAIISSLDHDQQETDGWRADIALDDLEVPENLREKPIGQMSGGWQRVTLMARAWVAEPDLLLLDEPTNHLDLGRIGILQRWLSTVARDVPLIVASHDRAFLDATTNRTLFLRETQSQIYALPYTRARAALAQHDGSEERRYANDMKQADQLRRQAAKLKNIGINSGSDLLVVKTKQLKDRAARLEEAARPAHRERSAGVIRLANSGSHAKAMVTLDDIVVATPDGRQLFHTGKIWVDRGDRVVLLGANGVGKTRLMNMVQAALTGHESPVRVAASAIPGISDQSLAQLDRHSTPFAAVSGSFDLGDQRSRGVLAGAGIPMDVQQKPISALSGGQKARLAMLMLRLTNPNFYLLDEPTNHLDIEGQESLESELMANEVTCLLVSHDRSFVRAVGTRFWQIERRKLIEVDSPEPFFASALTGA
ncbi:MAG: ABC transporter [Cereibacter sphaeroides]|uniref:ABC transporter n=1 Tax=Cereibacter sphaeroides TaxID=1063 RepID=A0A2W5S4Z0_CERSP|nr:MAG: ABC transporter [Cereibacter sphaeroides]